MSVELVNAQSDAIVWTTNLPNVESFTCMVWYKKTGASGVQPNIFSIGDVGVEGRSLYLGSDTTATVWDGSSGNSIGVDPNTTDWYCVAFRGNGTALKGYIKVETAGSFTTATGTQSTGIAEDVLCLGRWISGSGADCIQGLLRAYKQWNTALTDGEIDTESTQLDPVVTSGLQRYIGLSDNTDTNDQSGNGYNPTIEGALATNADNPTTPETGSGSALVHRGLMLGVGI